MLLVVGFLSKWKSGQKSRRKIGVGFFGKLGRNRGAEGIEEGDFVVGFLSKWKIFGLKNKVQRRGKKEEDRLLVGLISGSGRFGHKSTSANKRKEENCCWVFGGSWKLGRI